MPALGEELWEIGAACWPFWQTSSRLTGAADASKPSRMCSSATEWLGTSVQMRCRLPMLLAETLCR